MHRVSLAFVLAGCAASTAGSAPQATSVQDVDPAIAAFLETAQNAVIRCYGEAGSTHDYDDVILQFTVGTDGAVARMVAMKNTMADAGFVPCLEAALEGQAVKATGSQYALTKTYRLTPPK